MDRVIDQSRRSWSTNALAGAASYLVTGAAYIALYAGLDHLSLVYEFKGLGISLWSPSIGLSVAILLAYGPGFTPAIFVAIFLTDLYVHALSRDIASIVVTAAILASGYAALAWFLQHQLGFELKRAHLEGCHHPARRYADRHHWHLLYVLRLSLPHGVSSWITVLEWRAASMDR